MKLETFFESFAPLADAPNGVQKLRELILQLAVLGKLVPQDAHDEPAAVLLAKIKAEKERLIQEKKIRKSEPLPPIEADEVPFDLPQGWEWVRLDSVCTQITDGAHHTPNYVATGVPFLSVKDVSGGKIDLTNVRYIPKEEHDALIKRCNPEFGDLLFTKVGTTGIARVINVEAEFSIFVSLALLKLARGTISPQFLEKVLNSPLVKEQSAKNTQGIGNKNLVLKFIKSFVLPVAPLAEQQRIVAKVDQLMALCDELEARQQRQQTARVKLNNAALERLLTARASSEFAEHWQRICDNFDLLYDVPETIGKLRQAILKFAFQGMLTPINFSSGPVVITSTEKDKKTSQCEGVFEIPKTWAWSYLELLCEQIGDIDHKMPKAVIQGVPFLSAKDLKDDGTLDFGSPKLISEEDYERLSRKIKPNRGDIIYSRIGARLGKARMVETDERFLISYSCCLIRPNHQIVYNKFLQLFLDSDLALNQAVKGTQSIGVPDLGLGEIKKYNVPVPPLDEQKLIVEKILQMMALCGELEAKLRQAQTASAKLMTATVQHLAAA